jgi:hypothetical protein
MLGRCYAISRRATRNSMFALKVRNQGSASAGMPEGSSRLTTKTPPRWPLCSQKYTASGLAASRIRFDLLSSGPITNGGVERVKWQMNVHQHAHN